MSSSDLPWEGFIALPPSGGNHAYFLGRRGKAGMRMVKNEKHYDWAQAQYDALVEQGAPVLAPGSRVTVLLDQRFRTTQSDVDGLVKATQDLLQAVLRRRLEKPPTGTSAQYWNDRDVYFLAPHKRIDRANPGIRVLIALYREQDFMRLWDYFASHRRSEEAG